MRHLPASIPERRRALGARIARLRIRANLTQQRVIEATGIPYSTYQRIEYGTSDPRATDLMLIADALGVRVSELWHEV